MLFFCKRNSSLILSFFNLEISLFLLIVTCLMFLKFLLISISTFFSNIKFVEEMCGLCESFLYSTFCIYVSAFSGMLGYAL